ncbi:Uncharacterised protein [Serratia quinivorans]|nr:Uncharacterised protein [Serratia quinivorans]
MDIRKVSKVCVRVVAAGCVASLLFIGSDWGYDLIVANVAMLAIWIFAEIDWRKKKS